MVIADNNNHVMALAVPMMSQLATVLSSGLGGARSVRRSRSSLTLPERSRRLEAIRRSMIEALPQQDASLAAFKRRVTFATEAEQLWYLRTELMTLLSAARGEAHATRVLHAITLQFDALVPASLFASALRV